VDALAEKNLIGLFDDIPAGKLKGYLLAAKVRILWGIPKVNNMLKQVLFRLKQNRLMPFSHAGEKPYHPAY
jgi:hypothetical protein